MQNLVQRGKNIDYLASQLVSASTAAGKLVQSGDAVVIGDLIGVAASTATLPTDLIDVQHSDVFNLQVTPAANVVLGQKLYIDGVSGVISDNAAKTFYGWALSLVNANVATTIPIKLKH